MEDCAQGLTAARVAGKLNLRLSDLQCVFIGGSRLWGTAKPSSDYDLIVVSKEVQGKTCVHAGDGSINAQLLGTEEYLLRIRQHRWLELITLWMPPDYATSPSMKQLLQKAGAIPTSFIGLH